MDQPRFKKSVKNCGPRKWTLEYFSATLSVWLSAPWRRYFDLEDAEKAVADLHKHDRPYHHRIIPRRTQTEEG